MKRIIVIVLLLVVLLMITVDLFSQCTQLVSVPVKKQVITTGYFTGAYGEQYYGPHVETITVGYTTITVSVPCETGGYYGYNQYQYPLGYTNLSGGNIILGILSRLLVPRSWYNQYQYQYQDYQQSWYGASRWCPVHRTFCYH